MDASSIQAEIIESRRAEEPRLRDSADERALDTLLAALDASNADYLITGDKDLLAVAGCYPILTSAQFWSRHGEPRAGDYWATRCALQAILSPA